MKFLDKLFGSRSVALGAQGFIAQIILFFLAQYMEIPADGQLENLVLGFSAGIWTFVGSRIVHYGADAAATAVAKNTEAIQENGAKNSSSSSGQ